MPATAVVNPSNIAPAAMPCIRTQSPLPWRIQEFPGGPDGPITCILDANGAFADYTHSHDYNDLMRRVNACRTRRFHRRLDDDQLREHARQVMNGLNEDQLGWFVRTLVVDSDMSNFINLEFSWSVEPHDHVVRVVSSNIGVVADGLTPAEAEHLMELGNGFFSRMRTGYDF